MFHLAVGIFAGVVTISMPKVIYEGKAQRKAECTMWHKVFYENEDDPETENHKHWDPIGGMQGNGICQGISADQLQV